MKLATSIPAVAFMMAMPLRRKGNFARDNRCWADAVQWYQAYLDVYPRGFAIWVQLGHAHQEAGNLDSAYAAYARALEMKPADADLLLHFGRLLGRLGRHDDALKCLMQSFELDKNADTEKAIVAITGKEFHGENGFTGDPLSADFQSKILKSGYFDPNWYSNKYPDIGEMLPLDHFYRFGAGEWRSPGPYFDTEWYMLQNQDLIPGVAAGSINPLLHYLDHGRFQGRAPLPDRTALASVKALLDGVIDIDPDLYAVDTFANQQKLKSLPIYGGVIRTPSFLRFKDIFEQFDKPYDYIIAVPWLRFGGADLVSMHISRAIAELDRDHSILVLVCDFANIEAAAWLPRNVDMTLLQPSGSPLTLHDRVEVLACLVQAIRPKAIINVNSEACWELFKKKGLALSQITRTYGCAFCRDFSADGRASGYVDTHLRESLPWMSGVISDNASFFDELVAQFGIPTTYRSRFVTLYNPALANSARPDLDRSMLVTYAPAKKLVRPKILWASRLSRQKNIAIVKEIADRCPQFDFDIWGKGELEHSVTRWSQEHANIFYKGSYARFSALPVQDYTIFLYTSLWDGIPNVLLEAASYRMPIVAPAIGGISELINNETGWLISDPNNVDAYVAALTDIMSGKFRDGAKLDNLGCLLSSRHSWENFKNSLVNSGMVERAQ